ncbi:MAG: lytic transglycosylase domain-containing protein [Candidatus Gastranaerophilales bacterium]|nr:lytic transglycosylase domain-containing protein [Candidatus Gastranaerophilales bacterium]
MSMELTGLDIALRRMQSIERQFQELSGFAAQKVDSDFQAILNNTMAEKNVEAAESPSEKIFSPAVNDTTKSSTRKDIDSLIDKYAEKNNLDASFVKALVKQESGFNPKARSHCGAMGLMQLMPATAMSLGVNNAYDAEQNIAGGTKYLRGLLDRFDGNKEFALAAYNAGPGAVNKYGGIPPYNETKNYVKNVMANYQNFKGGI